MRRLQLGRWISFALSVGWLTIALSTAGAQEGKAPRRLLFFHRSAGFQHSVIEEKDGARSYAEMTLRPLCEKQGWELVSTKDGALLTPEFLDGFDAYLFYTTGDLTANDAADGSNPMSKEAKAHLLKAIEGGKGFVGFHCAADTFHSPGDQAANQPLDERDPYIRMLGGEFVTHGSQQKTTMTVVDSKFPGAEALGPSFDMHEEWYSLRNFADNLHVLLVNETTDMDEGAYERPPYPASWIRKHGDGRVFYTSMGHREDVWTSPQFESLVVGGITWAVGDADADATPNMKSVTPEANVLPGK